MDLSENMENDKEEVKLSGPSRRCLLAHFSKIQEAVKEHHGAQGRLLSSQ